MKKASSIDTNTSASKTDLASLKTKVDNFALNKLKTSPAGLGKLGNVVDIDVIKKTVYDELVNKVNGIDTKIPNTSELVSPAQYDLDNKVLRRRLRMLTKRYPILLAGQKD